MLDFVEEVKFTRAADRLLTEDERFGLMVRLARSPEAGDVIPGSGGCRKLRFAAKGKGSRGGVRVIYFYRSHLGYILLLDIYSKNERSDLTAIEIQTLKSKVKP